MADAETLRRIRALAVPPAWTGVWICSDPRGHLQATGRDARGRKQYRYHKDWMASRSETKYGRMIRFGSALPALRRRVHEDLEGPGLTREKVLAAVVHLLDRTAIRVGNQEYTKANGSFGLTTLRDRHVRIDGPVIEFAFLGKSAQKHRVKLNDARLSRIVARCRDLPGYELFQYLGEGGTIQVLGSGDVNDYVRQVMGDDFTAKDFRTWRGTVEAARALGHPEATPEKPTRAAVVAAVARVAERLGNRPSVTRKYYVHPAVLEAYERGALLPALARARKGRGRPAQGLEAEEQAVLHLLQEAEAAAGADLALLLSRSLRAKAARRATPPARSAARRDAVSSRSSRVFSSAPATRDPGEGPGLTILTVALASRHARLHEGP